MASAGAMSAIAGIVGMHEGRIPATMGTRTRGSATRFDLVTERPRAYSYSVFQVNAFGFGGQNASLILSLMREQAPRAGRVPVVRKVRATPMNLLVKGTSGPLTGEVQVPKLKVSRAPRVDFGVARAGYEQDSRSLRCAPRAVHDGRPARVGTKIEVDGQTLLVTGGPYHVRAQGRLGRQLGINALFHDRLGVARRRANHASAQKYFRRRPVGPLLEALAQMGVAFESANGCPPIAIVPGTSARRNDRHSRYALAVDLGASAPRSIRERAHRYRSRRRTQRASVHRADRRNDARLRSSRDASRQTGAISKSNRDSKPAPRPSSCPPTSDRPPSASPSPRSILRTCSFAACGRCPASCPTIPKAPSWRSRARWACR